MFPNFVDVTVTPTKKDLLIHKISELIIKDKLPKVFKSVDVDIVDIQLELSKRGYLFAKFFDEFVLVKKTDDTINDFYLLDSLTYQHVHNDSFRQTFFKDYQFKSVYYFLNKNNLFEMKKRIPILEKSVKKVGEFKRNKFKKEKYTYEEIEGNLQKSGNLFEIQETKTHWIAFRTNPKTDVNKFIKFCMKEKMKKIPNVFFEFNKADLQKSYPKYDFEITTNGIIVTKK